MIASNPLRGVSSVGERLPYKQDVTGSNPVLPNPLEGGKQLSFPPFCFVSLGFCPMIADFYMNSLNIKMTAVYWTHTN